MELTYLGTATVLIDMAGLRLLTDPAFDPIGSRYDFGPWYAPKAWFSSEKTYNTPIEAASLGAIDAVLLSHDQHADNLDHAGRQLLSGGQVARVVTTPAGARRMAAAPPRRGPSPPGKGLGLGDRALGLVWGASTKLGSLSITATPGRHGPLGTPRIDQVCGFVLEAPGEPTIWISGDTILPARVRRFLESTRTDGRRIDVAIVHCGGVRFPGVPLLGDKLFTFDAAQAIEACRLIDPGEIIPVHREGWSHFRQPVAELMEGFTVAGLANRTRLLGLGETLRR